MGFETFVNMSLLYLVICNRLFNLIILSSLLLVFSGLDDDDDEWFVVDSLILILA